jgi:ribosomal protein S18 acetylase RimI-like enzyme
MHYAAFSDSSCSQLTGFLSFVITKDNAMPEAEITALVDPQYRRNGICHALISHAVSYLETYGITRRTCRLPENLSISSINKGYAHSEYLMQLDINHYHTKPDAFSPSSFEHKSSLGSQPFEFYFSEDGCEYLMYTASDATDGFSDSDEEPIAVCSLDYQISFTSLYGVYVDDDLRGKGLGTLLLTNLLADYFEEYDSPLILNVRSTNSAAVSLYKQCGFVVKNCISYYYV